MLLNTFRYKRKLNCLKYFLIEIYYHHTTSIVNDTSDLWLSYVKIRQIDKIHPRIYVSKSELLSAKNVWLIVIDCTDNWTRSEAHKQQLDIVLWILLRIIVQRFRHNATPSQTTAAFVIVTQSRWIQHVGYPIKISFTTISKFLKPSWKIKDIARKTVW